MLHVHTVGILASGQALGTHTALLGYAGNDKNSNEDDLIIEINQELVYHSDYIISDYTYT